MSATIKFAKINPKAIIPTKRDEDAGYDIYPCFDDNYIRIPSHCTVMIPTGIASNCSYDYCFILKERGSTGTKGIAQRCGVIDSGYVGEWVVPITNTNDIDLFICKKDYIDTLNEECAYASHKIIYPYEKAICQALLIPVPDTSVEEITYEELKSIHTERGTGKLGSSNK